MADPTTIPNLRVRSRASQITGLVDGDPVTQWDDETANAFHWTQATGASKPTYKVVGGESRVRFDGVDDFLGGASFGDIYGGVAVTAFVIARGWTGGTAWGGGTAGAGDAWLTRSSGASHWVNTNEGSLSASTRPDPLVQTYAWHYSNDVYDIYYNGDNVTNNLTAHSSPANTLRVGNWKTGDHLTGDVLEVLLYDRILTTAERAEVHSYVQDTYGIAVSDYVASGITVALGQAVETDTAHAITAQLAGQIIAVGQASELNTAQPLTVGKTAVLGQAIEASTAQPITVGKTQLVGQAAEADAAQPLTTARARALGQAVETDTAQPVSTDVTTTIGQATETDTAQPITTRKAALLGQATEVDTARTLTAARTHTLGQATETDTAQTITPTHAFLIDQAVELDTAHTLGHAKAHLLGHAVETDTAQPLSVPPDVVHGQDLTVTVAAPRLRPPTIAAPTLRPPTIATPHVRWHVDPPHTRWHVDEPVTDR